MKWALGSICHFKFPKVVVAHILGKWALYAQFLLSVYPRTCLSIIIEIGSYLTARELRILARFLETLCSAKT